MLRPPLGFGGVVLLQRFACMLQHVHIHILSPPSPPTHTHMMPYPPPRRRLCRRYATLPNIMKAKKKKIAVTPIADMGVDVAPRITYVYAVGDDVLPVLGCRGDACEKLVPWDVAA